MHDEMHHVMHDGMRTVAPFQEVHYKGEMLRWPHGCGGQSLASYLAPQIARQRRHLESLAEAALVS